MSPVLPSLRRKPEASDHIERLYALAEALQAADKALTRYYDRDLRDLESAAPDRAKRFEAIFPKLGPAFEIEPYAAKIEAMADKWQAELDAEWAR